MAKSLVLRCLHGVPRVSCGVPASNSLVNT